MMFGQVVGHVILEQKRQADERARMAQKLGALLWTNPIQRGQLSVSLSIYDVLDLIDVLNGDPVPRKKAVKTTHPVR